MLKMIEGGKGRALDHVNAPPVSRQVLLRQLSDIEDGVRLSETSHYAGPKAHFSMAISAVVGWITVAILFFTGPWPVLLSVLIALALPVSVYFLVNARSRLPDSWVEQLDQQLTNYEPFDKPAMCRFQEEVRRAGCLDPISVMAWLQHERHALDVGAVSPHRAPLHFLDKIL
jgi:hypothetical protein